MQAVQALALLLACAYAPALDDLAAAQCQLERRIAIARAIKLAAVLVQSARVVHRQLVADGCLLIARCRPVLHADAQWVVSRKVLLGSHGYKGQANGERAKHSQVKEVNQQNWKDTEIDKTDPAIKVVVDVSLCSKLFVHVYTYVLQKMLPAGGG